MHLIQSTPSSTKAKQKHDASILGADAGGAEERETTV
jgi:hypothetical protein